MIDMHYKTIDNIIVIGDPLGYYASGEDSFQPHIFVIVFSKLSKHVTSWRGHLTIKGRVDRRVILKR